jgi:hypothetical protein
LVSREHAIGSMRKEAFTNFIIIETKEGAIDLIEELKVATARQRNLSFLR